ncbi:hypothetical protein HO133_002487 [Letharia lupina]|uniref:Uncharacterized protein n=1 Tax=Letharia lupina TaxID=560253 RepID=A0A8H6FA07_9LECA|nr:uncharacterized protein HO133_002487 [Letharia lupina]KAF6220807.1 hypothetical protein HO133_002487 [Letharia lupina]
MSRNPPSKDKLERSQFSVDKPLTSEIKTKIRSELTRSYHSFRKSVYGLETKTHWASNLGPDTGMTIHNNPITPLDDWTLQKFCNKPAALYWARPAQINECCPRLTFACIYKQWFRSHNRDPNIEFGQLFANPIRISSTGPETIAAILVVLDNFDPPNVTKQHERIKLDEPVQRQTVVMVLTGDDNGLSAPITFDTIRSHSLPLGKADIADDRQEEEAFPDLGRIATDRSIGPTTDNISFGLISADEWVNMIMHKLEEEGDNIVIEMKSAAWKMKAKQQGDDFLKREFDNSSPMWE